MLTKAKSFKLVEDEAKIFWQIREEEEDDRDEI